MRNSVLVIDRVVKSLFVNFRPKRSFREIAVSKMVVHRNGQGGFTLLEVLAALSVLALGMVILLQTDALNIDRTLHASRLMEATLLAQEKMDEVFSKGVEVASAGVTKGQEDIFSWTRTVAVSQYPGVSEIRLSIDWSEGSRERSYSVITFLPE